MTSFLGQVRRTLDSVLPRSLIELTLRFRGPISHEHFNPEDNLHSVLLSPNGRYLWKQSLRGFGSIYDLHTGNEIRTLENEDGAVWSPDSTQLAIVHRDDSSILPKTDPKLSIFSVATETALLLDSPPPIFIDWSSSGGLLSLDKKKGGCFLRVWDSSNDRCLSVHWLDGKTMGLHSFGYGAAGCSVRWDSDKTVLVFTSEGVWKCDLATEPKFVVAWVTPADTNSIPFPLGSSWVYRSHYTCYKGRIIVTSLTHRETLWKSSLFVERDWIQPNERAGLESEIFFLQEGALLAWNFKRQSYRTVLFNQTGTLQSVSLSRDNHLCAVLSCGRVCVIDLEGNEMVDISWVRPLSPINEDSLSRLSDEESEDLPDLDSDLEEGESSDQDPFDYTDPQDRDD